MWEQVRRELVDSTTLILTNAVSLLPRVVALLLALAVSGVLAWIVGVVLRRMLRGVDLDARTARWVGGRALLWFPGRSPTLLLVRLVASAVVVLGLMVGIAAFDPDLASDLVLRTFAFVPNLVLAVVLLLAGNLLANFLARGVLIGAVNLKLQQARLLAFGVKWLILLLTAAMALDHIGIGGNIVVLAFGIVFGGIVLAASLAIGLGAKDFVSGALARSSEARSDDSSDPFSHV
jgi:Mechanosensitive ion channel, conserved TM helix